MNQQTEDRLTRRAKQLFDEAKKLGLIYEGHPCPTEDMVREELFCTATEEEILCEDERLAVILNGIAKNEGKPEMGKWIGCLTTHYINSCEKKS